ncbi:hypothetical protein PSU4_07180 [Pseudonocardia sulfidoxydans NBRC 16205]|uniref:Uncharacterized protein n=1 Tax=Pseudonocardia sulfidoxydans NBRC 16205 TaxID=1223511 RepID=A0A511DDL0_9PSEU|nr:hypothetical protein [Pseudonocardia sulfidoxydans]GEL21764.1 hypothetical protein PSU4_07180 [Pseudonocardia sulfidoxydans NBRC 16205]
MFSNPTRTGGFDGSAATAVAGRADSEPTGPLDPEEASEPVPHPAATTANVTTAMHFNFILMT